MQVNRCTNANIYINGANFMGIAQEIELPKLNFKMVEHQALGMFGLVEYPAGVDKLEAKIKWNAYSTEELGAALNPFSTASLQIRASVEVYGPGGREQEIPLVVYMKGQFKTIDLGNFKQHDNVERESMFNAQYVKVELNGVAKLEFDALSNTFKVNGVDVLQTYKTNVGN